ncbi:mannitol dehydrogenase family protein [Halomonas huangheensis]|nr:mannitol dehydrogenase family protein [Halomonas huangheensis]ALM54751.1 mannitol dehydrogenase [Halomonas huangheensis]
MLCTEPVNVEHIASCHSGADIGIVHLGLGAFHRAHQAVYVERNLSRHEGGSWGICSANIRSNQQLVSQLRDGGMRYHVAEYRDSRDVTLREVTAIREALYAGPDGPDLEALLERMSDPGVRIVTLTVTEKGYYLKPNFSLQLHFELKSSLGSGALLVDAAAIAHDIQHPQRPQTAPGMLVEALSRRREAGIAPFTVLCCDNMPDNGKRTRQAVVELAGHRDAQLAEWIAQHVAFPCSMVDRIVPAMTAADFQRLAELGVDDPGAVVCEAFSQWVVEDHFPQGRPDWEHDGVQMVADVAPFETMKLRMLNGSHSLLAYLGSLAGIHTVSDAMQQQAFTALLQRYMHTEAAATLTLPAGADATAYADSLVVRFANDSLRHRLHQIAMDGSQKLPQRWLQGALINLQAGRDATCTALGVAGWMRYTAGSDLHGNAHGVDDPIAERLAALHAAHRDPESLVMAFLAQEDVFPSELAGYPHFVKTVVDAWCSLQKAGVSATLVRFLQPVL